MSHDRKWGYSATDNPVRSAPSKISPIGFPEPFNDKITDFVGLFSDKISRIALP